MKLSSFFAVIALVVSTISVQAQVPINTIPEGITTFNIPATVAGGTSFFSAPLSNDPIYTGAVSSFTSNTVTVGDTPAPWSTVTPFETPAAPYFLKFLSGAQSGRILQVLSNTTNTLTLDVTDNSPQTTALNASGFSVQAGDTFEVFAGDTIALMFGVNTQASPLVLKGGTVITADTVSVFVPVLNQLVSYYFNTTAGFWEEVGKTTNANNTIIRPYAAFLITRRANEPATSFVLTGRVAEVNHLVKTIGSNSVVYDSTGYPVDVKLSQLQLGSNWTKATIPQTGQPNPIFADTVSIYNTVEFDSYYELSDNTWRRIGGGTTDQSNFVIPAATTVVFLKRVSVSGATSYLQPVLPYSLTN